MKRTQNEIRANFKARLDAKQELFQMLPNVRAMYENAVEYARSERWSFDEQRYSDDVEYRDEIEADFENWKNRTEIFNEMLAKVTEYVYSM